MNPNININLTLKDTSEENLSAVVRALVFLRSELEANGFNNPIVSAPRASSNAGEEKGPNELAYLAASGKQRMKVMNSGVNREDWAAHLLAQMNGTPSPIAVASSPNAPDVASDAPIVETPSFTEDDLS